MVLLIGVTGYVSSGKDTVAEYLIKKGFEHISLSGILSEDLKRQRKQVTRENLQQLGNELRTRFGGGILAERAMGRMLPGRNYVITSIGRVDEIMTLKENSQFRLIFTDAPVKKRYEWYKKRQQYGQAPTFAEFMKTEKLEAKGGGAQFRELDNCKDHADILILNSGTFEELNAKIEKALKDVDQRPNWDDYFFGIMEAVSRRATCDRGKAAAVIVKGKTILATGYVGAPMGLPHCDEDGHLMEKTLHIEGVERWHCVRTTHAEQNAIAQAAKHGVAIDGSKIYVGMEPCLSCAKMIINSGIKEVICKKRYHGAHLTRDFFKHAGVKMTVKEDVLEKYDKM